MVVVVRGGEGGGGYSSSSKSVHSSFYGKMTHIVSNGYTRVTGPIQPCGATAATTNGTVISETSQRAESALSCPTVPGSLLAALSTSSLQQHGRQPASQAGHQGAVGLEQVALQTVPGDLCRKLYDQRIGGCQEPAIA